MKTIKFILVAAIVLIAGSVTVGQWTPSIWNDFVANQNTSRLPDFSYAGYRSGEAYLPARTDVVADVTDFGAVPDDGNDDAAGIQAAIDFAQLYGGGVVYFPAGRYDINVDANNPTFIQLNTGNIVLRGAGSGTNGTILHLNNVLETDVDGGPAQNAAVISVGHSFSSHWGSDVALVADFTPRGSEIVNVSDSSAINEGDVYLIVANGAGTTELNEYLLYPLVPSDWPEFIYANGSYNHLEWVVEVSEVIDSTTIRLKQPTRVDLNPAWTTRILKPTMIEEIGIEDMRFTSEMPAGYYSHHAEGQDYWPAVRMRNVRNGWVKNVVFVDYTIGTPSLYFCKNITVTDIIVDGGAGHYGPALARAHDCLIDGVEIYAGMFHSVSVSARSQGNVFRNIDVNYTKATQGGYQSMDFHCGYPTENLFELITNARVSSSGSSENFPHSSRRNTFWNIKADEMVTPYGDSAAFGNEFFFSFYFSQNYVGTRTDSHILHPESIVVGAYHDTISLEVDGNSSNQSSDWIYVEGLNQPEVYPQSLYQAQFDMRVPCIEPPSGDLTGNCEVNLEDFAIMSAQWLDCTHPGDPACVEFY